MAIPDSRSSGIPTSS